MSTTAPADADKWDNHELGAAAKHARHVSPERDVSSRLITELISCPFIPASYPLLSNPLLTHFVKIFSTLAKKLVGLKWDLDVTL